MAKKVLVAVFSASGVTKKVGKEIARIAGADFHEIIPGEIYTSADLDWTDKKSRSSVEMNDPSARPEIANSVADMGSYDTVIVGFPIWWGVAPRIIETFLESYDFSGKKIIPFCTSGGSDIGRTAERIRSLVGENACVDTGRRLGGEISEADLKIWTEGMKL